LSSFFSFSLSLLSLFFVVGVGLLSISISISLSIDSLSSELDFGTFPVLGLPPPAFLGSSAVTSLDSSLEGSFSYRASLDKSKSLSGTPFLLYLLGSTFSFGFGFSFYSNGFTFGFSSISESTGSGFFFSGFGSNGLYST
jgi:hypothetical protein